MGALRTSMATCGYEDIAAFHKAEVMVAPALQSEGKQLQREQGIGMGPRGRGAASLIRTAMSADPALVGDVVGTQRGRTRGGLRATRGCDAMRCWCSTSAAQYAS